MFWSGVYPHDARDARGELGARDEGREIARRPRLDWQRRGEEHVVAARRRRVGLHGRREHRTRSCERLRAAIDGVVDERPREGLELVALHGLVANAVLRVDDGCGRRASDEQERIAEIRVERWGRDRLDHVTE